MKLRKEVATLRAAASEPDPTGSAEQAEIEGLRVETQQLESQKQAIIAQANAQKALLAKEIKALRSELDRSHGSPAAAPPPDGQEAKEVEALLVQRQEFEENFTRTIRDLRRELEASDIKALSKSNQVPLSVRAMLQLSNERVEKAMEEADAKAKEYTVDLPLSTKFPEFVVRSSFRKSFPPPELRIPGIRGGVEKGNLWASCKSAFYRSSLLLKRRFPGVY